MYKAYNTLVGCPKTRKYVKARQIDVLEKQMGFTFKMLLQIKSENGRYINHASHYCCN